MAAAGGDEVPGAAVKLQHALGVQQGVHRGRRLGAHILDMHVIDALAQLPGHGQGIGAHPEQVAGVQIHAHHGAYGLAQPQQCLRIVDQLPAVELQSDAAHAARLRL